MRRPFVSIVITTLNEEKNIASCLDSIFRQDYPKNKFEVIMVDNGSEDKTRRIAKKFNVKIITNKIRDTQVSKRIGLEKSKGELWMWFDADMRMVKRSWLKSMVKPLVEREDIVASLAGYKIKGDESPLTKFLTLESKTPFGFSSQLDPIYQFFTTPLQKTVVEKRKGYFVCEYQKDKIPAQGLGVFRKKVIKKVLRYQGNKYMDLDTIAHLVNEGYTAFAYVPNGVYHYFMPNLRTLLSKRLRNIKKNYLGQEFERSYTWFNLRNSRDLLKVFFWVLYVHLIVPELVRGVYKALKYETWVGIYQPVVSLLETDVIIIGFIFYYLKYRYAHEKGQ